MGAASTGDVLGCAVLLIIAGICASLALRARWPSDETRLEHLDWLREQHPGGQWTLQDVDRYFRSSWPAWAVLAVLFAVLAVLVAG